MELRELFAVDIESLTTRQAQHVSDDIIAAMTNGCIAGSDQQKLKSLLIAAQRKTIDTGATDTDAVDNRGEVLQKIKEAEARGDKRTARYLAEAMGRQDIAAQDRSGLELVAAVEKQMADDVVAAEEAKKADQRQMIDAITQELLYQNGWEWTEEEARQEAARQVLGIPAYEEDTDETTATRESRGK